MEIHIPTHNIMHVEIWSLGTGTVLYVVYPMS